MRMVIQKVERASVSVDGVVRGEIGNGLMALVGLLPTDDEKVMGYMLEKLVNLRIYEDENDKLNLSVKDVGGGILYPLRRCKKGQKTQLCFCGIT